jgi:hypothetical protein
MRLFFFSYRKMSIIILTSFFVLTLGILYYSSVRLFNRKTPTIFTTSSTVKSYKTIHIDTNGNGKKDTMNINIDYNKKEYSIEIINDNGKRYSLSPTQDTAIGPFIPWWPLQITVSDVNLDRMPEILAQMSAATHEQPSYIFRWNGKEYANVLSGKWQGISLFDVNEDRIPEVVTEEKSDGIDSKYTAYTWISKSYNKQIIKLDNKSRGYDKIQGVISMLHAPVDGKIVSQDKLQLIFTKEWLNDHRNLETLKSFSKNITGIQLQNYIGKDYSLDDDITDRCLWKLRYLVFRKFGSDITAQNYIAEIETVWTGPNDFKINKVKFISQ